MTSHPPTRFKRTTLIVATLLFAVAAGLWCTLPSGSLDVTVRKETTFVLGPLNDDGTVNYVAARNQARATGVNRENNAAALVLEAIGPEAILEHGREQVFAQLGVALTRGDMVYFRPWPPQSVEMDALPYELGKAPWRAAGHPEVAAWLEGNERPLEILVSATELPRFFVPWVPPSNPPQVLESWTIETEKVRAAVDALACRAALNVGEKRLDAAWRDARALYRLGRLLTQDGSLPVYLYGMACETAASRVVRAIAASSDLQPHQAISFARELELLADWPDVGTAVDLGERLTALDAAMIVIRERSLGALVKPVIPSADVASMRADSLLRYVNGWFDRQVAACGQNRFVDRGEALRGVEHDLESAITSKSESVKSWLGRVAYLLQGPRGRAEERSEIIGNVVLAICFPTIAEVDTIRTECVSERRLATLALFLAAYKGQNGGFPEMLQMLCPDFTRQIPPDPFNEASLHYRVTQTGYVLYSVGPNVQDDGGKGKPDDGAYKNYDVVLRNGKPE